MIARGNAGAAPAADATEGLGREGRGWLAYALASMLLLAATNFILGYVAEKSAGDPAASVKAAIVLWLGTGLLGVVGTLIFKASGRGFAGLPGKAPLLLPLAAGVTLALGMLLLKAGLGANPLAKGPIVAVTSSNSLVVALLAWAYLREKLVAGAMGGVPGHCRRHRPGQPGRRRPRQPHGASFSPSWPCSFSGRPIFF